MLGVGDQWKPWLPMVRYPGVAKLATPLDKPLTLHANCMQTMKCMRLQANNPNMESVTMIKLDMPVKKLTLDDWHIVGNKQGLRMLIVDLKAAEETKSRRPSLL